MKKKWLSRLYFLLILSGLVLLALCGQEMKKEEITDIDLIQVLSVDEIDGQYTVSGLYKDTSGTDNPGQLTLINGSGSSAYLAFEEMKNKNNRNISVSYVKFILLGASLTANKVLPYLEFLARDELLNKSSVLYHVQDKTGKAFLEEGIENELPISDILGSITEKNFSGSTDSVPSLIQVLNSLMNPEEPFLIPLLKLTDENICMNGYGLVQDGKLLCYYENETAILIDLFRNNREEYPLSLTNELSVEIINYHLSKEIREDRLYLDFEFESSVRENFANTSVKKIERLQNEKIKKLLNSFFAGTQQNDITCVVNSKVVKSY